jgi:hypothetical protein
VYNAERLHQALELLYPQKDWSATKKFHNLIHHVPQISAAAGHWERVNLQAFELANRLEKFTALYATNRKDIDHQIVKRSLDALAAQHYKWQQTKELDGTIETLEEKRERARGTPAGFEDSSNLQFPIHELFERNPLAPTAA